MQPSYKDFHQNRTPGVIEGNTIRNSLTPSSEVLISLHRFSQSALSFNKSLLPFPYLFLSESDKNLQNTDKISFHS
jgi:hypothetical protein